MGWLGKARRQRESGAGDALRGQNGGEDGPSQEGRHESGQMGGTQVKGREGPAMGEHQPCSPPDQGSAR